MRRGVVLALGMAIALVSTGCGAMVTPVADQELEAPEIVSAESVDQPAEVMSDDRSKGQRPFGDLEWDDDKRAWVGTVPTWKVEFAPVEGADGYAFLVNGEFRGNGTASVTSFDITHDRVADGDTLTVVAYIEGDPSSGNPLEGALVSSDPSGEVTFTAP